MKIIKNQIEGDTKTGDLSILKNLLFRKNKNLFKKNIENSLIHILNFIGLNILINMFFNTQILLILLIVLIIFILLIITHIIQYIRRKKYIKNIKKVNHD